MPSAVRATGVWPSNGHLATTGWGCREGRRKRGREDKGRSLDLFSLETKTVPTSTRGPNLWTFPLLTPRRWPKHRTTTHGPCNRARTCRRARRCTMAKWCQAARWRNRWGTCALRRCRGSELKCGRTRHALGGTPRGHALRALARGTYFKYTPRARTQGTNCA